MADIIIELTHSEWEKVVRLANDKDNGAVSEQVYADQLMSIIGPAMPRKAGDGDTIRLVVVPKIQVSVPGRSN